MKKKNINRSNQNPIFVNCRVHSLFSVEVLQFLRKLRTSVKKKNGLSITQTIMDTIQSAVLKITSMM